MSCFRLADDLLETPGQTYRQLIRHATISLRTAATITLQSFKHVGSNASSPDYVTPVGALQCTGFQGSDVMLGQYC